MIQASLTTFLFAANPETPLVILVKVITPLKLCTVQYSTVQYSLLKVFIPADKSRRRVFKVSKMGSLGIFLKIDLNSLKDKTSKTTEEHLWSFSSYVIGSLKLNRFRKMGKAKTRSL